MSALAGEIAPARVHDALKVVLEREEIGAFERASPLERFLDGLFGGLDPRSVDAAVWFVWVILGTAALVFAVYAAIWMLDGVPAWRRLVRGRSAAGDPAQDDRRRRVEELRERARAAEARGDLALALRLEFFAIVVALGEHGELEFRPAWTNRELCARGKPAPALAERLLGVLDELDPRTWGAQPARPADLARLRALATELGAGEAA